MNRTGRVAWMVAFSLTMLASGAFAQERQRGAHNREGRMADHSRAEKSLNATRESENGRANSNKLTAEERRQLRQDIHQAGRDIYSARDGERRQNRQESGR